MHLTHVSLAAAAVCATLAGTASAAFTITQNSSASPTYAHVLNFDAPGSPTGNVAANAFASYGVSSLTTGVDASGSTIAQVNTNPGFGWLGTGNVCVGAFGIYMQFSSDVSALSVQYWDDSGPGSFFGGGAAIQLKKGGVEVAFLFLDNPAFGPTAPSWFHVSGDPGETFDEINFVGFGFSPNAYIDNLSWESVPAPATAGLLALAGLGAARRRRS